MLPALLDILICPRCRRGGLQLAVTGRDGREVRDGVILCAGCGSAYSVEHGIVDLLADPPAELLREVDGWAAMLGETTPELDAHMLALPYLDDPNWQVQAANFDGLLDSFAVAGKRVLDLGSGRGWSARWLARRGAEVVATDILRRRYIGLETAELYLGHDRIFFERVLADMERLPFADGSFDVAFSNASVHHALHLAPALREAARVLRPGGALLLASEPVHPDGVQANLDESAEVHHGINEHTYTTAAWLAAVGGAGLEPRLLLPQEVTRAHAAGRLHRSLVLRPAADYLPALLGSPAGRRLLAWQPALATAYDDYGMPLVLIARKPPAGAPRAPAALPPPAGAALRRALAAAAREEPGRQPVADLASTATHGLYPAEGAVAGRPFHWTGPKLELALRRPAGATMLQLLLLFPPVERVAGFLFDGAQRGSLRSLPAARRAWRRLNLELPPGLGEALRFTLFLDAAWSPAEAGLGDDRRALGDNAS
jgi:SAM-dependent methyltransferase